MTGLVWGYLGFSGFCLFSRKRFALAGMTNFLKTQLLTQYKAVQSKYLVRTQPVRERSMISFALLKIFPVAGYFLNWTRVVNLISQMLADCESKVLSRWHPCFHWRRTAHSKSVEERQGYHPNDSCPDCWQGARSMLCSVQLGKKDLASEGCLGLDFRRSSPCNPGSASCWVVSDSLRSHGL